MKRRHAFTTATVGIAVLVGLGGLTTASAEPVKGKGSLTLYYIAEVKPQASGGTAGKVKTTEGQWETYWLSPKDTKSANMQGSVAVKEPDGAPEWSLNFSIALLFPK